MPATAITEEIEGEAYPNDFFASKTCSFLPTLGPSSRFGNHLPWEGKSGLQKPAPIPTQASFDFISIFFCTRIVVVSFQNTRWPSFYGLVPFGVDLDSRVSSLMSVF